MGKKVNILIVHYNTPYLTEHLVMSINKFTPNAHIYIFDNGNFAPFDASKFSNVTVFDNTHGQYINFDKWLEKYPNRTKSNGKINGWGSAKHCVSVEKCMTLINEPFILLDSDVLLKKDITEIADEKCVYVGEVITQPNSKIKRVLPYICYINAPFCIKNRIHYFDDNRMHGLYNTKILRTADLFDTGAAFFVHCNGKHSRQIKTDSYVVHYGGASWKETKEKLHKKEHELSPFKWIDANKSYWLTGNQPAMSKNNKVIYTCITGNYEPLDDPYAISEGFDYICFTNSPSIKSDVWKIRPIPDELKTLSEVKKQRCIKINPHKYLPEYDLSIWVDGCMKLTRDVNKFLEDKCASGNIFIPKHPQRDCIYLEMDACIKQKKDTSAIIEPQRKRYKEENFPAGYGLVQSNIIVRRHNSHDCIKLMETWWEEVKKGSHRDQLSFDYARWKNQDVKVTMLDKGTCHSAYFKWDSSHGRNKARIQSVVGKVVGKPVSARISVSQLMKQKQAASKPQPKKETKPFKKVVTQNPTIRRKLVSMRLKEFLMP